MLRCCGRLCGRWIFTIFLNLILLFTLFEMVLREEQHSAYQIRCGDSSSSRHFPRKTKCVSLNLHRRQYVSGEQLTYSVMPSWLDDMYPHHPRLAWCHLEENSKTKYVTGCLETSKWYCCFAPCNKLLNVTEIVGLRGEHKYSRKRAT